MTNAKQDDSFYEVAGGLAKLMAVENIRVEFRHGVPTAFFDIKNRILVSPIWKDISIELRDMILVHETGHALDTPYDKWKSAIKSIARKHHTDATTALKAEGAVQQFINIVEDPRIDKRQKRRFPGARRDYVLGLQELHDRNFFELKGKDINTLDFPDRLNIYFKGGQTMNIKFSDEEFEFVQRVEDAETFEEVIGIADDLYGYARKKGMEMTQTQKGGTLVLEDAEDDGDVGDGEQIDYDQFDNVIDNRTKKPTNGDGEESEDEGEGDESKSKSSSKSDKKDDSSDSESKTSDKGKATGAKSKNEDSNSAGSNPKTNSNGAGGMQDYIPEVMTESAIQENLKKFVNTSGGSYVYTTTPTFDLNKVVNDFSVVIPEMEKTHHRGHSQQSQALDEHMKIFKDWRKSESEFIRFMVKEFEMRKAADMYARLQTSKTGVIDTNRIHGYQFNEDIFRRSTTCPEGKNHGFVMLLDWSGSMFTDLKSTLKQLFAITMFCKQVQIPFDVYLFRTDRYNNNIFQNSYGPDNVLQFAGFRLRNILSSRMNTSMMNRAMDVLWKQCLSNSSSDSMESTPLNQSILVFHEIVNEFKKKYKVQIVSTIILTDGQSDYGFSYNNQVRGGTHFIRDHITGAVYKLENLNDWYAMTDIYLKMLKDRTNSKLIGFFLTNSNKPNYNSVSVTKEMLESWKNYNFATIKDSAYDEFYVVQNIDKGNPTMNIKSGMSSTAIQSAFTDYGKAKKSKRILLSRFIEIISKEK